MAPAEAAALGYAFEASHHLAETERRLADATCAELVGDLYPSHVAQVTELVSRASLATTGHSVIGPGAVEVFAASAQRLLAAADTVFSRHAEAGFPGCLLISDVRPNTDRPTTRLLTDGWPSCSSTPCGPTPPGSSPPRWLVCFAGAPARLALGRRAHATRTAEAVAALALGRPVPAGSAHGSPPSAGVSDVRDKGQGGAPFGHLGYEVAVLKGADRDYRAEQLRELWASGSPVMVAVASALDERLHHSSVELAVLLDDASRTIEQRVLASLVALPSSVPVVLMADHGFRENPSWGKGPEGRYVHGGTSLQECVVPVVVAS